MTEAQKKLLLMLAEDKLNQLQATDNEIADRTSQITELREAMAAVEQEGQ